MTKSASFHDDVDRKPTKVQMMGASYLSIQVQDVQTLHKVRYASDREWNGTNKVLKAKVHVQSSQHPVIIQALIVFSVTESSVTFKRRKSGRKAFFLLSLDCAQLCVEIRTLFVLAKNLFRNGLHQLQNFVAGRFEIAGDHTSCRLSGGIFRIPVRRKVQLCKLEDLLHFCSVLLVRREDFANHVFLLFVIFGPKLSGKLFGLGLVPLKRAPLLLQVLLKLLLLLVQRLEFRPLLVQFGLHSLHSLDFLLGVLVPDEASVFRL
mmetsp:Transcript_23448/g.40340  ORF Transcript_23448/g.40340 Transcript_23448/m.40340 type:complete len:263 (-) Transcript_23448:156-944(-)